MAMMKNGSKRAVYRVAALLAATTLAMGAYVPPASADSRQVTVEASVDGHQLAASTQTHPLQLFPRHRARLDIKVTNNGSIPIDVRAIRLEGQVVGLTFFAYDTDVAMTVAPGQTGSRRFLLDLSALDGQATGLIPGAVRVLDSNRHVLGKQTGVIDVRGSLLSVYGLFGIGVALLTALSFLGALVGLARHRLPQNRWRRALRFLTPGLGLGLVVNFTLSATRVFVPELGRWLTITTVFAAIFFFAGYLTPTPDLGDDDELDDEQLMLVSEKGALSAPPRPALVAESAPSDPARSPPPTIDSEPVPAELDAPPVAPVTVPVAKPTPGPAPAPAPATVAVSALTPVPAPATVAVAAPASKPAMSPNAETLSPTVDTGPSAGSEVDS